MKVNLKTYLQTLKMEPLPGNASSDEKINFLKALYFAHVQTFPYSNFELRKIAKQHPVQRNSLSFFSYKNLLTAEHGGYCFQTAALLADALTQMGYTVSFCAARVLMGAAVNSSEILKLPPSHLVLKVQIDEKHFLLDPGLGSSAPRFPILITGKDEPITQNGDVFKFYSVDNTYVLEKKTRQGWLRLAQTDLQAISKEKAAMNLLKLERYPELIGIRDSKVVIGSITEHGRKSLAWDVQSKQLKFSKSEGDENTQKTLASFEEGYQLLADEFGINHVSAETLEAYCTETTLPKPIKPWTVDFPLDQSELKKMEQNLRP